MKKLISLFTFLTLTLTLTLTLLTACGSAANSGDSSSGSENKKNGGIKIVASIFPEYDWVCEIIKDNEANVDLTLLLDNGVDLHSYQPTAEDIITISNCDLFIYVGGESDQWITDALSEVSGKEITVINLLEVLGDSAKEEEVIEGMESYEDSREGDDEEPEYDEHVWLSIKNAEIFCQVIADTLSEIDPEHEELYSGNAASYLKKLSSLDASYQDVVDHSQKKTLLFGDRFPFRYLTDDYGLAYYAAFNGCSAETEASFDTITFLAKKVDTLQLSCILTIDNGDEKIAKTILSNTAKKDQQILTINSLQSVTSDDVENGVTYLSVMEDNLKVLEKALQ